MQWPRDQVRRIGGSETENSPLTARRLLTSASGSRHPVDGGGYVVPCIWEGKRMRCRYFDGLLGDNDDEGETELFTFL